MLLCECVRVYCFFTVLPVYVLLCAAYGVIKNDDDDESKVISYVMKTGWNERTQLTYCDLTTSIYWTGWNVCWSTVLVTSVILWSKQFLDITLCSTLRHRPLLNEWFIKDESCDFCLSSFNVRLFLCHATKSWGHVVTDFVKQEQWERWRGKRKLVLGISTVGASARARGYYSRKMEIVYAKSCNMVHFVQKMIRSAIHYASIYTVTMGTPFPRVPSRNEPGPSPRQYCDCGL